MPTHTASGPATLAPPQSGSRRIPWRLFVATAMAVGVIVLGSAAIWGWGETGQLHMTRYTARLAFLLFIVVMATGALARLFPSASTRWLRRNRRYLGLSFALAHFLHLAALTTLFITLGDRPGTVTLIGGGLAYVFVGLMALTSNDYAVRLFGPRLWRGLHLTGISYIWLIFMNSYLGRVASDAPPEPKVIFVVLSTLGFLAVGLRIVAWTLRRKRRV